MIVSDRETGTFWDPAESLRESGRKGAKPYCDAPYHEARQQQCCFESPEFVDGDVGNDRFRNLT